MPQEAEYLNLEQLLGEPWDRGVNKHDYDTFWSSHINLRKTLTGFKFGKNLCSSQCLLRTQAKGKNIANSTTKTK